MVYLRAELGGGSLKKPKSKEWKQTKLALCQVWGWWKSFFHSAGCCFVINMVFFSLPKLLMKLSARDIGVMFRKLWPVQIVKGYSRFSFILWSMYLIFILRSLIHLDLIFEWVDRFMSFSISFQKCSLEYLSLLISAAQYNPDHIFILPEK